MTFSCLPGEYLVNGSIQQPANCLLIHKISGEEKIVYILHVMSEVSNFNRAKNQK